MAAKALGYQLWSGLECDGGAWLADLPRMGRRTKQTNGEGQLTVSVPFVHPSAAQVDTGRIVRVRLSSGEPEEWRISHYSVLEGRDGEAYSITAMRDTYELSENVDFVSRVIERENLTNPHPDQVVETVFSVTGVTPLKTLTDDIVPALPSYWTLRTVEPNVGITVNYSNDTPRSGIQKVIAALGERGVYAEFQVEKRPGTAGYYLDIVSEIGASAAVLEVRTARNLQNLSLSKRRDTYATTVYPRGDDGTPISDARWLVKNVAGSVITLGMIDGSAGGPVGFNDQFNTNYYLEKSDFTLTQITDCDAALQTLTVASAAGVVNGQALRIRHTSAGNTVVSLSAVPMPTNPRTRSLNIRGGSPRTNYAQNPVFAYWTSGAPNNYTEVDPTGELAVAEENSQLFVGPKSAKLTHTPTAGAGSQFFGLRTADAYILPPFGEINTNGVKGGCWVYFAYTESGNRDMTVRVLLDGINVTDFNSAANNAYRDTWVRVFNASLYNISPTVGIDVAVGLFAPSVVGQNRICYLSGFFLEDTDNPDAEPYRINSSPAEIWRLGNEYLANPTVLSFKYEFSFLDLGREASAVWPYDDVVLGGSVRVRGTVINVDVTARILNLVMDDQQPLSSQASVSTIPRRFSLLYAESA